jgi:hypothetical protein
VVSADQVVEPPSERDAPGEPAASGDCATVHAAPPCRDETCRGLEQTAVEGEGYHRVMNAFASVIALLELQACHVGDPATATMLGELQQRVRTIGASFEYLRTATIPGQMAMGPYLAEVLGDRVQEARLSGTAVDVRVTVDEVTLPAGAATACGLLLGELFADLVASLPTHRRGADHLSERTPVMVCVRLIDQGDSLRIEVARSGVEARPGPACAARRPFSAMLVGIFVDQLRGALDLLEDGDAVTVAVTFPKVAATVGSGGRRR